MYQLVAVAAYIALWEHRRVELLDRLRGRRDPRRQADLDRAAADLDRELAANLELASLFDQTHQAVIFENAEFSRHGPTLARELPDDHRRLADIYARMPATESAMERRGPAASLRPEDRELIETWEGDVRVTQLSLRQAARRAPASPLMALLARLRGGRQQTGR